MLEGKPVWWTNLQEVEELQMVVYIFKYVAMMWLGYDMDT